MSAEEELLKAQAYRASLSRRERARLANLATLRGNPEARRQLDQKFQPLKGRNGGTTK